MAIKQVQTTCPYCGAGCQIMFTVDTDANKIIGAVPADGRTNQSTLCLKGHYGWDYLNDPQILTKRLRHPMIRKNGKNSPLEISSAIFSSSSTIKIFCLVVIITPFWYYLNSTIVTPASPSPKAPRRKDAIFF